MNLIILKNENDTTFTKEDPRAKHIKKILKLKQGDTFKAGIANKNQGIAQIIKIENQNYHIKYTSIKKPEPLLPITLICGMVRPITAKRILKDATTIGISKIIFTTTDTGEKSYQKSNLWSQEQIQKHTIDGASQSGNPLLPQIIISHSLEESLSHSPKSTKICLHNTENSPHLSQVKLTSPITIAIGSERGWSPREIQTLQKHNFHLAHIGKRILRTETAIPITLGIILSKIRI